MKKTGIIGLLITALGIAMLLFAGAMLKSDGTMNAVVTALWTFSYLFWIPTIAVGSVVTIFGMVRSFVSRP